MKIYWSCKSIPELAELPDKERRMILRRCWAKASRNWKTRIEYFVLMSFAGISWYFCMKTYGLLVGAVGVVIIGAVVGFIWAQVYFQKTIPYIHEELSSRE